MSDEIQKIILEELREHRKETKDAFDKINGRVRKVETRQAEHRGAMRVFALFWTFVSSIVAAAVSYVIRHI